MGLFDRLAVRAIPKAGLGMAINPTAGAGGKVKAATTSSTYAAPGEPLRQDWDGGLATRVAYLGHTYVMRCVRLRADTVAGLPFRAGPDPDNPSVTVDGAPLARLLGPATPQEPGGPNPTTTARAMWAWSIVQRIVTGRMAWELQLDPQTSRPVGLWPLVSASLDPIPSAPGSERWWDGFVYHTPFGDRPLKLEQVFYGWRPSAEDWRQAESVLQAAQLPIQIAVACDRYMWNLLRNGMVASKLVISPPFEDPGDERAWEDQFFSEFCGFDNAGKVIHAYAENDYDTQGRLVDQAGVQVVDLSMTSVDAQLLQMVERAKSDINIALGVAKSLIGDASQRIYANADSEYRNFWTLTALNDITEIQDDVNLMLAPQVGEEVGWFDLSRVVALQPPSIFAPPALKDAIDEGVVTPEQASDLLGIPAVAATGEDVNTAPLGEEAISAGAAGTSSSRSLQGVDGFRAVRVHGVGDGLRRAPEGWMWRHRPTTSYTLRAGTAGWGLVRRPREQITAAGVRAGMARRPAAAPALAADVLARVEGVRSRRREVSAAERLVRVEAELAEAKARLAAVDASSEDGERAGDGGAGVADPVWIDELGDALTEALEEVSG